MALVRVQGSVLNAVSRPLAGVSVAVLTQPAVTTTQPGSPLANIFADINGNTPLTNPVTTDGLGNYFFYIAVSTLYTLQVYGNGVFSASSPSQQVIPDQIAQLPVIPSTAPTNQFATGVGTDGNFTYGTPTVTNVVLPINAQTGTSYTVLQSDQGKFITFSNAAAIAVTIPQAGAGGNFLTGWFAYIENIGAGAVTLTPTTSTIDGASSLILQQNSGILLASDGTNYKTMRGVGATVNTVNAIQLTGATGLPAATGTNLWIGGNFGTPHLGRIFIGDATGWQFDFSKRVGSVTTDLFSFKDTGVIVFNNTSTGVAQAGLSSPSTGIVDVGANGTASDSGGAIRATTFSQTPDNGVTNHARMDATGISVGSGDLIRISSTTTANGTADNALSRLASGQVALGTGSPGDFSGRLYQNIANANVTPVTVTGTTAQTSLQTVTTLTAELNAVGRWITIRARGLHSSGATGGTITYKLAIGATNLITLGAFTLANNLPNNSWYIEFDVMVQTAGATGALEVQANCVLNNVASSAFFNAATIPAIDVTGAVTFTLSSTATQTTTSTTSRMMGYTRNN